MSQGELFGLPDGYPVRAREPRSKQPNGKTRWLRFRGRRRLCDECCQLIHKYGQGGAPLPCGVRWRRVDGTTGDTAFLCEDHARSDKGVP
jgi:hypothetical protein